MLVRDVVNQFRLILPKHTNLFSDMIPVASLNAVGGVLTVNTVVPHDLETGAQVTLFNIRTRTPIESVSQEGFVFTFETAEDHDLTMNSPDHVEVELGGFTEPEWDDFFKLIAVQNRRKFNVQSSNTLPILTGSEYLLEDRMDGIRGIYNINVLDSVTFTISGDIPDGEYTTAEMAASIRIVGSRDIERFINDHYTPQPAFPYVWGVITPHQTETSKNRSTFSDAIATFPPGTDMRLRLIDGFTFSVVVRIVDEAAAVVAIDTCRELRPAIYKAGFGAAFESGFSTPSDFLAIPAGDREDAVTNNNAFYVHSFDFEVQVDVTSIDAVEPINTRAFRDIFYTQEIGTQDMTSRIDLDDEPLSN